MSWDILWSDKSKKQLSKIDKKTAQRIRDAVLDCVDDPFSVVTRLTNSRFYKIRVGNYRVILDLQQHTLIIFVVETDLRKRVYK
ncbi:MAG TPA: type II toxin-antitoxin system RelE/ParE family toxin [Candidatus Nitrosotalea sp.]|nr:type II toxin-antitoxin system RelE/ParE family toxin [Candidatus Nitrosotalea sp.]